VISQHTFDDHANEIVDDNERYNQGGTNIGRNIANVFKNDER
jgi:hypothetical protein